MAYISRNPFAREEIHRRTVLLFNSGVTCRWCGNVRVTRKGVRTLYGYRIESDAGRCAPIEGLFCSVGCMRAYHS